MERLEALFARVRAVRDTPAVRTLLLDCWMHASVHGEESGLAWAQILLDGVTAYEAYERRIRGPVVAVR